MQIFVILFYNICTLFHERDCRTNFCIFAAINNRQVLNSNKLAMAIAKIILSISVLAIAQNSHSYNVLSYLCHLESISCNQHHLQTRKTSRKPIVIQAYQFITCKIFEKLSLCSRLTTLVTGLNSRLPIQLPHWTCYNSPTFRVTDTIALAHETKKYCVGAFLQMISTSAGGRFSEGQDRFFSLGSRNVCIMKQKNFFLGRPIFFIVLVFLFYKQISNLRKHLFTYKLRKYLE